MVCSILAALHYSLFPLAAMPGPYHIAVARPIYLRASGDGSWLYQEILVGLSENYQDSHQVATFRWFIVRADLPYPVVPGYGKSMGAAEWGRLFDSARIVHVRSVPDLLCLREL